MINKKHHPSATIVFAALILLLAMPFSVSASHAWGDYHWARTANPATIKVVDRMTADWDDNLDTAISD